MRVVSSSDNVQCLQCVDTVRNIWKLRWDVTEGSYEECEFNHKPTMAEIKNKILSWYNKQIENEIVNGFIWNGVNVYLSRENQYNYMLFSETCPFPLELKLGTEDNPVFYTFNDFKSLNEFKTQMSRHIQRCLQIGWNKKKNINWELYK